MDDDSVIFDLVVLFEIGDWSAKDCGVDGIGIKLASLLAYLFDKVLLLRNVHLNLILYKVRIALTQWPWRKGT